MSLQYKRSVLVRIFGPVKTFGIIVATLDECQASAWQEADEHFPPRSLMDLLDDGRALTKTTDV